MAERRKKDKGREIQLEGFGLLAATAVLIALLVGAFWAGRWFERQGDPGARRLASAGGDLLPGGGGPGFEPQGDVIQDPIDLESTADVFDGAGGSSQDEPQREIRPAPRESAPPRQADRQPAVEVSAPRDGRFWVQVFAGRDEDGAAQVVERLRTAGFPVRLWQDREGRSTLYKVQVGGYNDKDSAADAAGRLQSAGFSGAWVTETR